MKKHILFIGLFTCIYFSNAQIINMVGKFDHFYFFDSFPNTIFIENNDKEFGKMTIDSIGNYAYNFKYTPNSKLLFYMIHNGKKKYLKKEKIIIDDVKKYFKNKDTISFINDLIFPIAGIKMSSNFKEKEEILKLITGKYLLINKKKEETDTLYLNAVKYGTDFTIKLQNKFLNIFDEIEGEWYYINNKIILEGSYVNNKLHIYNYDAYKLTLEIDMQTKKLILLDKNIELKKIDDSLKRYSDYFLKKE